MTALRRKFRRRLEQVVESVLSGLRVRTADWYLDIPAEQFVIHPRDFGLSNTPEDQKLTRILVSMLPGFFRDGLHVYQYPKADVATDAVIFGLDLESQSLKVLLIERGREGEPFCGCWAFPGGFLNMDEDLKTCARRELEEECHLKLSYLEQLYTFGAPDRDPRGRVLSVAHWGIVRPQSVTLRADDDAVKAQWFDVTDLPELAFDHADIFKTALNRLRGKLRWQPVGVWLLPHEFTLRQLQNVYEVILCRDLNRRTFTKKVQPHIEAGVLESAGETSSPSGTGRPAVLYHFNTEAYERLVEEGLAFEV